MKVMLAKTNPSTRGFMIGGIVLAVSSFLAIVFVQRQFCGYDLSPLIDLSWRLANHQIPGEDFINVSPPLLVVLTKAVSWGTLHWIDLTIINIAATGMVFLFLYWLSHQKQENAFFGIFTGIILSIPLLYTNHIWLSGLTQLSGIIFFYALWMTIHSKYFGMKTFFSVWIASGILFISKQNVALPMIVIAIALFVFLNYRHKFALMATIIIGAASGVLISEVLTGYSLKNFLYAYSAVLERIRTNPKDLFLLFDAVKSNYPLALAMIVIIIIYFYSILEKNNAMSKSKIVFLNILLLVSLSPVLTDCDAKMNDVSLPIFIMAVGMFSSAGFDFRTMFSNNHLWKMMIFSISLMIIFLLALTYGYWRERMVVCGRLWENDTGIVIEQGYFRGLKTGEHFAGVLSDIARVKKTYPRQRIFFGPGLEYGYLITKSPSPYGFPLWWHPGTSYSRFDEEKIVNQFERENFDILILGIGERTEWVLPPKIINWIHDNCRPVNEYEYIEVYQRNIFPSLR